MIKIIIIYSIIELSILIICLLLIFFLFIQTSKLVKGNRKIQLFLEKLTFIFSLILIILIIISNNIKRIWQI
ncbi:hypothetical protein [Candidatus Karelsulcia muelleri]|uniref:hypothetical protein n=1 Tax=Candidatus Karelsulcia muelleri TaxID=336810 RepID=UPI00216AC03E|nr:hypothetical protein [Candidatus Karelsulcia muelleri]